MSIVPARSLSVSDLSILGNNVAPLLRAEQRGGVDRSLAAHGEEAHWFEHRPATSPQSPKLHKTSRRAR
jgi:hypothetical protein